MAAIPDKIKKNILDLNYNKYLQYYNTSIIIVFTYIVGILIALITKQIDYSSSTQLLVLCAVSTIFGSAMVLLLFRWKRHMLNILRDIKGLDY